MFVALNTVSGGSLLTAVLVSITALATLMTLFLISVIGFSIFVSSFLTEEIQLLPGTPVFNTFDRVTQMGAGWSHIGPDLLHPLILAIGWTALASWRIGHVSTLEKRRQD